MKRTIMAVLVCVAGVALAEGYKAPTPKDKSLNQTQVDQRATELTTAIVATNVDAQITWQSINDLVAQNKTKEALALLTAKLQAIEGCTKAGKDKAKTEKGAK